MGGLTRIDPLLEAEPTRYVSPPDSIGRMGRAVGPWALHHMERPPGRQFDDATGDDTDLEGGHAEEDCAILSIFTAAPDDVMGMTKKGVEQLALVLRYNLQALGQVCT
mmetsp:Transcript_33607/g.88279  ORF Transcript_33607/g.88279 Transcript_33607/m.88279 type:complete len:108 (+) Transcript_33607:1041-1364(+)